MRVRYLAALVLPAMFLMGSPANAAVSINCVVPLAVKCTVKSPKGLKRVVVRLQGPNGWVNVVDETYNGCPKEVTVSWDPINPTGTVVPTECTPGQGKLKVAGRGDNRSGNFTHTYNFSVDTSRRRVILRKASPTLKAVPKRDRKARLRARPKKCRGSGSRQCGRGYYCRHKIGTCRRRGHTGVCAKRPRGCTREYRPVCGCNGKTYPNACVAASNGVSILHKGKCKRRIDPRDRLRRAPR